MFPIDRVMPTSGAPATGCEQWFSLLQTEVDVEEYLLALDLALVVRDGNITLTATTCDDIDYRTVCIRNNTSDTILLGTVFL